MGSMKTSVDKEPEEELYKAKPSSWSLVELISLKTFALLLSPLLVAILGAASRGDVMLYLVMVWANWDQLTQTKNAGADIESGGKNATLFADNSDDAQTTTDAGDVVRSSYEEFLHAHKMDGVHYVVAAAITLSFVLFFGVGGFLQWYYYIQRRDTPETWKCQPNKFLTKKDERQEILLGACNLVLGASVSGAFATYTINGGKISQLYFAVSDYGWPYLIFSTLMTFIFQDAAAYYLHRMLHLPFFYKRFHKLHHKWHSPTAFSAVAMHPAEFLLLQTGITIPMFLVPIHFLSFLGCIFYVYYFGMIDHSGIDMESIWPWQPPVRFHDDHHKYFHVNFGFNTMFFDKFHDTLRKTSRIYSEEIFYGKGLVTPKNGLKKSD